MQYSRTPVRRVSIADGASNAAGATTTGTTVDNSTLHRATVVVRIQNGATAPGVQATVSIQFQIDNSGKWYTYKKLQGGVVANAETADSWEMPPCLRMRAVASGNTGQAVVVEATVIGYNRF
jgi:hypothetical protein